MRVRLNLTIDYTIDYNLEEWVLDEVSAKREIKSILENAVNHLAGEGLLTGDGPLTVDSHEYQIIFD